MAHDLSGYVEVPDRIKEFFEKYPDGSLCCKEWDVQEIGGQTLIVYTALAFRTPDDPRPGEGTASEPFPGLTPYTKNSELMNAETSAWGRALTALGFVAKTDGTNGVASANEVRNRRAEQDLQQSPMPQKQMKDPGGKPTQKQREYLESLLKRAKITRLDDVNRVLKVFTGREMDGTASLTKMETSSIIERLKNGEVPSLSHPTDVPADSDDFTHPPVGSGEVPWDDEKAVQKVIETFDATEVKA